MKIELGKQYRTRDGREVRIYAVDGDNECPVHGAVKLEYGWEVCAWRSDGRRFASTITESDLVEVKPRIKRKVWVNVYEDGIVSDMRHCKQDCDDDAVLGRIACVEIDIDVEEGHGL